MRTTCDTCHTALASDSDQAYICSYECTFCHDCMVNVHQYCCPNCGGEFQKRPKRKNKRIIQFFKLWNYTLLYFNGQAKKAIDFYSSALGLEINEPNLWWEPRATSTGTKRLDHACRPQLGRRNLAMFADSPDLKLTQNPNVHISLNYTDLEEMKSAFKRWAKGEKLPCPKKQFWNATYGQLIDQFGIHWMMNCDHNN